MSPSSLSPILLRSGGPAFLPHSTTLRAGPLDLLLEQGEIRRVRLRGVEILRRIYLAVRGADWRTIPPVLSDLAVEAGADAFRLSYVLTHRQDEFDFAWRVEAEGTPEGRLRFLARGRSAGSFSTNRVGMCVLHPPAACAGRPARWIGPDGTAREGRFPETISPHEPFKEIREFSHQLEGGDWVDLAFEGEVFEMEDQRNWTDGSFKTYCPPADRPKPRRVEPGWETAQGVTLTVRSAPGADAAPRVAAGGAVALRPDPARTGALPSLGFSRASHGQALSPRDLARLRALAPAHIRCDFRLPDASLPGAVAAAAAESRALGAPIEAALVVGEDAEAALADFAAAWKAAGADAARILVFHQKSDSTPVALLEAAARRLSAEGIRAPLALGSKNDFVLLNRGRPDLATGPAAAAGLVYAMCPQVHAFDNRNLVESLEGQAWTLRTARSLWPSHPLHVSTISLKRSPFAASLKLAGPPPPDAWRKQADTRQLSLFGAAWTLGTVKRLSLHGAATATCFETTGPLGVLAGEGLDPAVRDFPGVDFKLAPDWVFPLYHVLADLAEFRGGEVADLVSAEPLRVDGLRIASGGRRALLVAGFEGAPVPVRLEGLPPEVRLRRLDEKAARRAVEDPEGWRAETPAATATVDGALELVLAPCEYLRVDLA